MLAQWIRLAEFDVIALEFPLTPLTAANRTSVRGVR
jgi:hypothetical protein